MDTPHYIADKCKSVYKVYPRISKCLMWVIKFAHAAIMLFTIYITLFSNNIFLLSMAVVFCSGILLLWYLFGYCFCTPIENALGNIHEEDAECEDLANSKQSSFISETVGGVFGVDEKNIGYIIAYMPFMSTVIIMGKICYMWNHVPLSGVTAIE